MEEEPVEAVEVEEYPEYYDEPRRTLTAGPIIAIIVVIIIIIALGFYFFYGTGVDDVSVLSVEEPIGSNNQYEGVEVRLLILSGGAQSVEGTGKLEIFMEPEPHISGDVRELVLTKEISISSDRTNVNLNYNEFAVRNGNYTFRFSMDGKSDDLDQPYYVRHIPSALEVEFGDVLDPETDDKKSIIIITPRADIGFGGRAYKPEFYNKFYNIKVMITDPFNEVTTTEMTMFEWHSNQSSLQIDPEWETMGYYSVSAEFENLLVKDSSPYKKMSSQPEEITTYANIAPEMGDISHSPTIVRRNVEMTLTVRAMDFDTNGGIEYFLINWGDSEDPAYSLQEVRIDISKNGMAKIDHTFTSSGPFTIEITAADNGYIDDSDEYQLISEKEFAFTTYNINVIF